jgi:predicted O-methyltransferase YrrM
LRVLYSLVIFCSSILLFAVQPVMAKALLPQFGGSAGVWVTCMLFFQVMLLMGYLYSWGITRSLGRRAQSAVHATLLILSLTSLSLRPRMEWARTAGGNPALSILVVLLISVGMPYFLLSATSPLLQSWFANSTEAAFPYRLFALSNAASLLALLAYPVAIEPLLTQSSQLHSWSAGYAVLVALGCATAIVHGYGHAVKRHAGIAGAPKHPLRWIALLWIALAACASTLWLAVANHLSQEVAPVPFLWVLPLSIYLLSFILCFEGDGWYRPALFRWLLPVAWIAAVYRIARGGPAGSLGWEIGIFSLALFACCMFCHGEVARTKPDAPGGIAFFYLMIALGGAAGAVFVGVAAPNLLSTYLELPIGIAASALLALRLLYGMRSPWRMVRLSVVALAAFVIAARFQAGFGDVVHMRNFYGALQVSDAGAGEAAVRALYNGRTLHGIEFLAPDRMRLPTAYYGPQSGAGRVLLARGKNARRVGLVGLGVGTLAAYGRPGDVFRFYEVNPSVTEIASRYFHFIGTSEARTDVVSGDGRLALEREPPDSFDILVLDAFADDSIPVHLLTREAFATYFRLLRSDGVLAIHLTNRYLELAPVVEAAAAALGEHVVEVHSMADQEQQVLATDWALVSGQYDSLKEFGGTVASAKKVRLWTDDYSNLFQVLK